MTGRASTTIPPATITTDITAADADDPDTTEDDPYFASEATLRDE